MASPYVQSAVPKREDGGRASAHLALVTVVLRIVSLVLAIISVGIIGAAKETNEYEDSDYNELTVHWKALNSRESKYLLSIGAIVALYELVVVIVACITQEQGSTFAGSLFTFAVDQVLAYLMFSSATAAVNEIIRYQYGHPSDAAYGDSRICKLSEWKTYCVKHEAGAAMGFVAFGALALVALLSGYRFSRHLS